MSRVAINTGSVANDGTGDTLRIAGGIINDNFAEIYSQFGDGTDLTPTWDKTAAGVNTTSNVGIGTTNPRFTLEVGSVGASGTSLYVNGNARITGILTVGTSSILLDGNQNKILVGSGISIDGNTGIISATAFYAGGSIITGGGGSGVNYWGSGVSGISTTANVAIGTVTPTSKLTVAGNSLFSGIATFRNNISLSNLTSSSNTLRFGSNSYIDQSINDAFTFQINSATDTSSENSSFVFRTTKPGSFPIPDQAHDALRVYSGGKHWDRLVRVYTNFHVDNDAFVAGDLQVGAASTLIGLGNTLGTFKVGAGGTVITTTSSGFVGIGSTSPTAKLTVAGNVSVDGSLTASNFYGDGSGLTGIVGSGSGVIIEDSGSVVGTAGTINFGDNLTVSPISAGIVTVTGAASGGGIAGIDTTGTSYFNQLSASGIVTATSFVGDGSGLTGITTAADSEKLSGQDPCFYVNYNNLYNYPEKIWDNVNQGGVGSGVTITGISTSYTFSSSRTVAGVSTDKLTVTGHLYYPTSTNVGPEVDVLVLYHGTIDSPGVTPIQSAQTFIDIATNVSQLNVRDKIIFSVAYPQDNIPAWNTGAANPAAQFPEFGTLFNYGEFYFGDNLYYAEAALLWVKENLNNYLSSAGIGKSISRVYTFGHSQGGLLVHRLNTMHSVDGVIANAPGPIDLLSRCAYDESTGVTTGTCYKIRIGIGSTADTPETYLDDSLKSYLSGTLSPMLFTQALDDTTGNFAGVAQTTGMLTIVQPGLSSCTEYGPIEFNYYSAGGHAAFVSNTTLQEDIRNYVHSGVTGSYAFSNIGIGTTNPTSALTVKGNTSLETLNVSGIVTFKGSTFGDTLIEDGNIYSMTGFTTFGISVARGVDFLHQGASVGKVRISGDGVYGNGRLAFYNGSNNEVAVWDSNLSTGSISIYNYTNSGTENITISAGSSVVLQHGGTNTKLQTLGAGVTITGTTFTNQLVSSGVVTATSFSGSNTLKERTTVTGVTTSIVNNGIGNTNITGYKSYALMKVGLSTAGWLRLYTDSTSRDADVVRSVGEDPTPGSGVIAEVVTTGISTTQIISPFVMGGNLEDPADTTIYASITNLSGSTQAITANLTILQLEA